MSNLKWPDDYINKVIQGDCLEVMKGMPDGSVDLVVTDPPYRQSNSGGGLVEKRKGFKELTQSDLNDFEPSLFLEQLIRIQPIVNAYIFCSKNLLVDYIAFAEANGFNWNLLLMAKKNPIPCKKNTYLSDVEYIMFIRGKGGAYFDNNQPYEFYYRCQSIAVTANDKGHITEKPTDILSRYIQVSSPRGAIVCDPYFGIGSTAVACRALGRKYIGIEINPDYCKIAEDRLRQEELF